MKDFIPTVKPLTKGQDKYLKAIDNNSIVICFGAAGVGKTFLAAAKAVEYLRTGKVEKILITRAAVDFFHENIGTMPGYLDEKYEMYTIPIMEELSKLTTPAEFKSWKDQKKIEFSPVSLLRGRTFDNTFMIVEEASSCTYEQLKLILTRIGQNTRLIMAGDLAQSDLRKELQGGLEYIAQKVSHIDRIEVVSLQFSDIVRNDLIGQILQSLR